MLYITCDKYGSMYLWTIKPKRGNHKWHADYESMDSYYSVLIYKKSEIYSRYCSQRWEDDPWEVELVPVHDIKQNMNKCSATSLMQHIDANRPDNKMCLSNMECEQIDNAFATNNWKQIINYIKKYLF